MVYDFHHPGAPLDDSQKIPSELIEDYLHRFFMIQVEALAYGRRTPQRVREDLNGVHFFVMCSCGIHASIATGNQYLKFTSLDDEQMIELSRKTFRREPV
jgi:hypothetical protein